MEDRKLRPFILEQWIWVNKLIKKMKHNSLYKNLAFLNLFLPQGTFGQLNKYLVAPLHAKIDLKVNKSDNWWHPLHYLTAPKCTAAPRLRTTELEDGLH